MDDAQKRAEDFNTEARIAELEARITALRRALERVLAQDAALGLEDDVRATELDDDLHALVRGLKALTAGRIVVVPTKKKPKKKP